MSPLSRLAPLALLAACLTQALAFSPGFNYGGTKVRGVNLGGWLVLEVNSLLSHFIDYSFRYLAVDYAQFIREYREQCDCRRVYLRSTPR